MGSAIKLSPASLLMVASLVITLSSIWCPAVEGDCTVQNESSKEVIIVPVDVSVSITVEVGGKVAVPPSQQHCYFKNAETGHQLGPVTLIDGTLVAVVDGATSDTVDVYLATDVLGILQLGVNIFISL